MDDASLFYAEAEQVACGGSGPAAVVEAIAACVDINARVDPDAEFWRVSTRARLNALVVPVAPSPTAIAPRSAKTHVKRAAPFAALRALIGRYCPRADNRPRRVLVGPRG